MGLRINIVMLSFKTYMEMNTVGKHNDGPGGGIVTSDQSGSEQPDTPGYGGHPLWKPGNDLMLPTVTNTQKIMRVEMKNNPIRVLLADNTELFFTRDEFRRIRGSEPAPGRLMTVVFQRHHGDKSRQPSQIQDIVCQG